jgi:hypothetical protein
MNTTQSIVKDERAPARPERVAFPIQEFCWRNAISLGTYHKLKNAGLGPKEMRHDSVVRISAEAELEWQRMLSSNPQGKARAKLKARASKAGKLAAASPRHVSNRRRKAAA